MFKKLFTLLIVFVIGCAGTMRTYHVNTRYDEFEKYHVYEQNYNHNKTGIAWEDALNVRIIKHDNGKKEYNIIIYKENPGVWLFANQPLKIKADTLLIEFAFLYEQSNVLAASNIQKWGYYSADKESIDKIINAQRVIAKISTTDGFYEINYKTGTIAKIKEFMMLYDK